MLYFGIYHHISPQVKEARRTYMDGQKEPWEVFLVDLVSDGETVAKPGGVG